MRPRAPILPLVLVDLAGIPQSSMAQEVRSSPAKPVLPPAIPWNGASRSVCVSPEDRWATPCERSGLTQTPRYDETVAWLERLAAAAPELRLASLGKSPEGRDIWMVIASRSRAFTPESLRATGKPILLAQAGIHAGEIDGKDAGMMLLRDMTVRGTKRSLLDGASFLFVPIFNVDGHERFSAYARINQRGPTEMGWRTTARNLNLNRDYGKLDTPEMRTLVQALRAYDPDLYADIHVTDGADYQYDVTWGYNGTHANSPAIAAWMDRHLSPVLERDLRAMGHVPGPLIFLQNDRDASQGIVGWTASARFSQGYGDLRHIPSFLVENHSLKPYDQRVLGTYVLLASALRALAEDGAELRKAIESDRARRPAAVPLDWKVPEGDVPRFEFLGIESRVVPSAVSGGERVEWTGKPVTLQVPYPRATEPARTATRPKAYWISSVFKEVIERLAAHGVEMERLAKAREVDVETYRIIDPKVAPNPSEGHFPVTGTVKRERRRVVFPPGSARVSTDQPLGDLAVVLLEPESPDSFFHWGFFPEILEQTEYADGYALESLAQEMLAADPALREEFERKLREDSAFAADSAGRLQWFYRRSPYFDERFRLYPVARE